MTMSKLDPGGTKIGWIGTGVMGRWMCQHLMTKGYKATVYNRSKEKAKPLLETGADMGRHAAPVGRAVRHGLRASSAFPRTCAKCFSARRVPWPAQSPAACWWT